ncbi:permease [Paenibacillus thermotolerans]|uniref:permease n=1 Tax=Paenibacillus thermotolerans TaxID=3027807 RepID=UPI002367E717|nr:MULTISPECIES: permease [unclassified Paenibacillus]
MFAGHFGLAAAVKAKEPGVPLWSLMAATQLLDILFVPLLLSGVETIDSPAGTGYGKAIIHADYTHSLVGAIAIAVIAGFFARRAWGKRAGIVIGSVVFSHWMLDLLVHRRDLPILPGNAGDLPLLGLHLWNYPAASMAVEFALIAIGFVMYFRSVLHRAGLPNKSKALAASGIMGLLLILSLITDVFGIGA